MTYTIVFLIIESTILYGMERLNKSKVDYSNIRVLWCKVFIYFIPKIFRTKFQNYSLLEIFLGYSENPFAYKILDITLLYYLQ